MMKKLYSWVFKGLEICSDFKLWLLNSKVAVSSVLKDLRNLLGVVCPYFFAITLQAILYGWVLNMAGPLASFGAMITSSLLASYWYHKMRYRTMPLNHPQIFKMFSHFLIGNGAATAYMLAFSICFRYEVLAYESLFFCYFLSQCAVFEGAFFERTQTRTVDRARFEWIPQTLPQFVGSVVAPFFMAAFFLSFPNMMLGSVAISLLIIGMYHIYPGLFEKVYTQPAFYFLTAWILEGYKFLLEVCSYLAVRLWLGSFVMLFLLMGFGVLWCYVYAPEISCVLVIMLAAFSYYAAQYPEHQLATLFHKGISELHELVRNLSDRVFRSIHPFLNMAPNALTPEDQNNLDRYHLAIKPAFEEPEGSAILPFLKAFSAKETWDNFIYAISFATQSTKALHALSTTIIQEDIAERGRVKRIGEPWARVNYAIPIVQALYGENNWALRRIFNANGQYEPRSFIRKYIFEEGIQVLDRSYERDPFFILTTEHRLLHKVAPLMDAACLKSMVEYIKCSQSVTKIVIPLEIWATIVSPCLALMTIRDFWDSVDSQPYNNFDPLSIKLPELVYGEFQQEEHSEDQQKYTEFLSLDGVGVSYSYIEQSL
ncbi:hypothetical protein [Candidatus Synchoanobacter obligatus]|uniref:Uncharacterized protein n=1 Tax=Candidatus Synchoanobacter obligatus TaxID=2919597 RepID=A0ABT1L686_9GAMM|nr:hypothetical protein [Candidatus Synchoanobacter obligatus]MCP8352383.1 hypothetical protein [Candidatus Synchoanobacter obligatus]